CCRCHPHHLVRHNLSDREDEVVLRLQQPPVHLHGHRLVHPPFGNLPHECRRNLSQPHRVCPPVVHDHPLIRRRRVHLPPFPLRHWHVRPQRRHHVHLARRRQHLPQHAHDAARPRVQPRVVRRQ